MHDLDFDLLPTVLRHPLFRGMPYFVEERLGRLCLPETIDRLKAASLFVGDVSPSQPAWQSRAHLRAGLSEFRSVAQGLYWDIGRRDVYTPDKSKNPLVHLVLRLRRIAVYVANAQTSERNVTATLEFGDQSTSTDIKILLLEDLHNYLQLERLHEYRNEDIERLCGWFDEIQCTWGAPHILNIGICQYALELHEIYQNEFPAPAA